MPPRPPLTTLVIHTWKEHGKPRPFSNEETSEASARARVSRSISIDAQLSSNSIPSDDESLPVHFRNQVSRSSTFDDGLSVHAVLAASRPDFLACHNMSRSTSVDDGMRVNRRCNRKVKFEEAVLPNVFGSTPNESEDEGDNLLVRGMPLNRCILHRVGGESDLPSKPSHCHMHRRTVSTSDACLRDSYLLAASPVTEVCHRSKPHTSIVARPTGLRVVEAPWVGEGMTYRKGGGMKQVLKAKKGLPPTGNVNVSLMTPELLCPGGSVSKRRTGMKEVLRTNDLFDCSTSLDTGLSVMAKELNTVP